MCRRSLGSVQTSARALREPQAFLASLLTLHTGSEGTARAAPSRLPDGLGCSFLRTPLGSGMLSEAARQALLTLPQPEFPNQHSQEAPSLHCSGHTAKDVNLEAIPARGATWLGSVLTKLDLVFSELIFWGCQTNYLKQGPNTGAGIKEALGTP